MVICRDRPTLGSHPGELASTGRSCRRRQRVSTLVEPYAAMVLTRSGGTAPGVEPFAQAATSQACALVPRTLHTAGTSALSREDSRVGSPHLRSLSRSASQSLVSCSAAECIDNHNAAWLPDLPGLVGCTGR